VKPTAGLYHVYNPMFKLAVAVKEGDSTDGTPVIAKKLGDGNDQLWALSINPGTIFFSLRNIASGSLASVSWPPVNGQTLVGSRSQAILGVTAEYGLIPADSDTIQIRLINTDLVWSLEDNDLGEAQVVLRKVDASEGRAQWILRSSAQRCNGILLAPVRSRSITYWQELRVDSHSSTQENLTF